MPIVSQAPSLSVNMIDKASDLMELIVWGKTDDKQINTKNKYAVTIF